MVLGVGLGIARKHGSLATGPGKDFSTKDWYKSLMHRMRLVKRRVSTKSKVYVYNYVCMCYLYGRVMHVLRLIIHFGQMLKTLMI